MAKKPAVPPAAEIPEGHVKARVLTDGAYGKCNAVVVVPEEEVTSAAGLLDAHPDAVAYAEAAATGPADDVIA